MARGAIGDGLRVGLGRGDHILQVLELGLGVGHEQERRAGHLDHRRQILQRVEAGVFHDGGGDDQVVRLAHHHVVAFIGGAHRFDETDGAARTRLVLDDHCPAGGLGQLRRHEARHEIGAAPRRERYDQPDGFGGIGLRLDRRGNRDQGQHGHQQTKHGGSSGVVEHRSISRRRGERCQWHTCAAADRPSSPVRAACGQ